MKIEITKCNGSNFTGFTATNVETNEQFTASWDTEVSENEKQFRIHEAMSHLGNKIIEWAYPGYEKDMFTENTLP